MKKDDPKPVEQQSAEKPPEGMTFFVRSGGQTVVPAEPVKSEE